MRALPILLRLNRRLPKWGLLLSALLLGACGGGSTPTPTSTPAVTVPEPASVNATGPGQFKEAISLTTIAAADIDAAALASGAAPGEIKARYAVQTYRLNYVTLDGQGQQIVASGLVALPQKPNAATSPVLSYQHGTIIHNAEAPSNHAVASEAAVVIASQGYIVLAPDYVGYGTSKGAMHPYLMAAPSASAVIDLLTAAKYWRQMRNIADNKQLFLAGYSEGGYVSMAAHRALQAGATSHRAELVGAVPGAGPYDVALTLDELLRAVRQQHPDLGDLLNPGFLRFLSDGARHDVRSLLLKEAIGADADVVFQPSFIDNYLADDMAAVASQSNVYDWRPAVPVRLFHGRDDRSVSYLNATNALKTFQSRGAGSLVSLSDCSARPAGHLECVRPYWSFMLQTLGSLARDL